MLIRHRRMNWEARMNDNPVSRRGVLKIGAAAAVAAMTEKIHAVEQMKKEINMGMRKKYG